MADAVDKRIKAEETKKKSRRVYSTAVIEELIKERNQGYDIPYDAFFNRDTELRAPNITFRMTDDEMDEYQKCYDDAEYFIDNYCKFMTDKGLATVDLRDYQKKIIKIVTDEEYIPDIDDYGPVNHNVIYMAARQTGKTTTISAFLAWMIVFHIDRNILIVANKEKTAIEIVDKITNIFRGLPFFLKPGCDSFGKTGLKLDNGSKIISSATTNTASIGFTIHCVLLDEFAHIPENIVSNFWRSVYPTLSSSKISQCIITSTPNGTTNKFYEIWTNPNNSFVKIRTDYWEVPGHDDAWAAQQKADFGEEEFAQEFELQFNVSSKMLAKADDLQFMTHVATDFVPKHIDIQNKYLEDENLVWHPDFDPNNIEETDKFVIIVDLAEGNGDADSKLRNSKNTPDSNTFGVYKVILNTPSNITKYKTMSCGIKDAFRYVQVGKFSTNSDDEIYTANVCAAVCFDLMECETRENVKVMIEMNFNGKSFTQNFQKHPKYIDSSIQRTYHTKPVPGERQRKRLGFKTTANKEYYCLKGAKLISMRRIIVTDRETMTQIQSFGYVRGKLKGIACHDDLSMPTFNHIPRMLDDESFIGWLEDILESYPDETQKYKINNILENWDMDNPETSDDDFSSMYGMDNTENSIIPQSYAAWPDDSRLSMNPFSENFNSKYR